MSLYGHHDALMIVEADSPQAVQEAINVIQAKTHEVVYATITCFAVNAEPGSYFDPGEQICIGVVTQPCQQEKVRNALKDIKEFDVVDVVFGEFDVMALFHRDRTIPAILRDVIRDIPFIQKTTTMLPHFLEPRPRQSNPAPAKST